MITVFNECSQEEIAKLRPGYLVITKDAQLYQLSIVDVQRIRRELTHVPYARAQYDFDAKSWYTCIRLPVTDIIAVVMQEDGGAEEAIVFAQRVKEFNDDRQREIDRLNKNYMMSVALMADVVKP